MGQHISGFQKSEFVETMKSNPMKIKVNEKSSENHEAEVPANKEAEVPENKEAEVPQNKEAEGPENKEAEVPQNKEVAAPDIY